MIATCFLGVGTNLGDRRKNIKEAVRKIRSLKGTKVIKISRIIETLPSGGPAGQPKYLNAALKIKTALPPSILLKNLKEIEQGMGRKKAVRWAARLIDLDILFYADKIIKSKVLEIPHPRVFERDFVLKPLYEVI